jgi:hypothetical protein
VRVGDLVQPVLGKEFPEELQAGIIIEVIDTDHSVPPVCKVFWSSGNIDKEWTDELEVISETS